MRPPARCDNCDLEIRHLVVVVAACRECRLQLTGHLSAAIRIFPHSAALGKRKSESSDVGNMRRVDPVLAELRVKRWLGLEHMPPLPPAELTERFRDVETGGVLRIRADRVLIIPEGCLGPGHF